MLNPQDDPQVDTLSFPERCWQLLSETPPSGFGYHQATGFGFNQAAVPSATYRVTWFPEANVIGQPTDLTPFGRTFALLFRCGKTIARCSG